MARLIGDMSRVDSVTVEVTSTDTLSTLLYLPFDTDLSDDSPQTQSITNSGVTVSSVQSKFGGNSAYFDGSSFLQIAYDSSLGGAWINGDYTLEAWIYPTSLAAESTIFSRWDGAGSSRQFVLKVNTNGTLTWELNGNSNITTSGAVSVDTWSHVAVSESGGVVKGFIDGVENFSATVNNPQTVNRYIDIGRREPGTETRYFTGYMDDVRFLSTALYTSAFTPVTNSYGAGVTVVNTENRTHSSVFSLNEPLVADQFRAGTWPRVIDTQYTKLYMSFDTNVQDESPSARSVTAFGNAAVSNTQAKFSKSLYLDGTGDYLTVPHASDLNLAGSDFTIEAWVYNTSFPSQSGAAISKWTGSSKEFVVFTIASGLQFYWSHDGSTNNLIQSTDGLSLNTWHHIAITSSSNVGRLFVDGQLQSATANFSSLPIYQSTTPLLIGARDGGSVSNYAGYIDDLMILKGHARYTANFTPPTTASGGGI